MKKTTSSYPISPADPDRHLMAIAKIVSIAFANGEYIEEIAQNYIGNCHYDWDVSRLIWDGERLVHHWGVWGYAMRLESVQLQVAGVGAVATDDEYRKRGLMQQAALASFEAMRQKGYDLSILRGRHYVKFGYARAWNYITYRLKPEEIPALMIKHPYRKLNTEHIEAMDALYNQTHQAFSGTAVRPTYRLKSSEEMSAYGWFHENGKLAGYLRAGPPEDEKENLQCLEAAGDPEQALAVMGELFKQGEYKTMTFFTLPSQHPLLQMIRLGNCVVETRYFATSGWRVRIVNLHSALEKICPLLETRLGGSHLADWKGQLQLDASEQKAVLNIKNGRIQVMESQSTEHRVNGGAGIGRLLIGSDEPAEVMRQENMTCTGDAMQLAQILFPNLYTMLSQWDEC
jgi:predicted N-acetyltransferase YhbS